MSHDELREIATAIKQNPDRSRYVVVRVDLVKQALKELGALDRLGKMLGEVVD